MDNKRPDPDKTYKVFKFSSREHVSVVILTITNWLSETGNALDGDIIQGLIGDDFMNDHISIMVPYIEHFLQASLCIDAEGNIQENIFVHDPHLQTDPGT